MKRLVVLGGACVLLGSIYAIWLERRRHLEAQEQRMKLQSWEGEGGRQKETTPRKPHDRRGLELTA